jgi:phosphatidylserine/phosphatidylglycerophosphate/cardiolipin synthase-like enzyme
MIRSDPTPFSKSRNGCIAAFSGRPLIAGPLIAGPGPVAGHAVANDRRSLNLLRPSGVRRPAPLTLNTLALEAIRSVPDGSRLAVAMYALSPRVPEFGALIAAARRGVRVRVLLDGRIGPQAARALQGFAEREGLPLAWRLTGRRMHQKYLCSPEAALVLTGTANMTEDAVTRHSDHRVLFRDAPDLAAAFQTDFDTIWRRLPPG